MLDNILEMFENHNSMMGRLKKATYKKNMYDFRVNFGADFQNMLETIADSEDKEATAQSISEEFTNKVYDIYSTNGKMKAAKRADLSFFMIYYVFPAILLAQNEYSTLFCDHLRDTWNAKFHEKIGYTDYDSLYDGFRDKLFGFL